MCISIVVDSGCTWHSHPNADDLINRRPCVDAIAVADGVEHDCTCIGDLPLVALDRNGKEHTVLLRDVRCVPTFTETLISIEQLWSTSRIDVVFRDRNCLMQVDADGSELVALPFVWRDNLYHWDVGAIARSSLRERPVKPKRRPPRALKGKDTTGVHSSHATSHLDALAPDEIAQVLHRRFHISLDHLKRLAKFSSDAPAGIARAQYLPCADCAEANSTHLPTGRLASTGRAIPVASSTRTSWGRSTFRLTASTGTCSCSWTTTPVSSSSIS